jgi:hypothetical protein
MKYSQDRINKLTDDKFMSSAYKDYITWNTTNKMRLCLIYISLGHFTFLPTSFIESGKNATTSKEKSKWLKEFSEMSDNYIIGGDVYKKLTFREREPEK